MLPCELEVIDFLSACGQGSSVINEPTLCTTLASFGVESLQVHVFCPDYQRVESMLFSWDCDGTRCLTSSHVPKLDRCINAACKQITIILCEDKSIYIELVTP
jgi:hypothetical protein